MPDVQLTISAFDEFSQALDKFQGHMRSIQQTGQQAFRPVEEGSRRVDASLSQTLRTSRAFAVSLIGEFNPALAGAVSQFTVMAQSARFAGTALAAFATIGIAAAVAALALWVQKTNEQADAQAKLNIAVRRLDVSGLESQVLQITTQIAVAQERQKTTIGQVVEFIDRLGFIISGVEAPEAGLIGQLLFGQSSGALQKQLQDTKDGLAKIFPIEARRLLSTQRAELGELGFEATLRAIGVPANERDIDSMARFAESQLRAAFAESITAINAERDVALSRITIPEQEPVITQIFTGKGRAAEAALERKLETLRDAVNRAKAQAIVEERVEAPGDVLAKSVADEQRLIESRTESIARAVMALREQFGADAFSQGIQSLQDLGVEIEEVTNKISEIERTDAPIIAIRGIANAWKEQTDIMKETFIDALNSMRVGLSDFLFSAVTGQLRTFTDVWSNFWKSLARIATDFTAQIALFGRGGIPSGGGLPTGGLFGLLSGLPGLIGLQEGGIVRRPTAALIGEHGPEAVIPLDRSGFGETSVVVLFDREEFNASIAAEVARQRQVIPVDISNAIRSNRSLRRDIKK